MSELDNFGNTAKPSITHKVYNNKEMYFAKIVGETGVDIQGSLGWLSYTYRQLLDLGYTIELNKTLEELMEDYLTG